MNKAFIYIISLFLLLNCSLTLQAQNNELLGSYKIVFIGKDKESSKYKAVFSGIKDAAKALGKEYSIEIEVLELSPMQGQKEAQSKAIIQSFLKNVDGIILSPSANENLNSVLKLTEFHKKEIVLLEQSLDSITPLLTVQPNEIEAGKLLAKAILKQLPTQGRVAILTSTEPSAIFKDRMKGVKSILGYKRIETVIQTEPNYKSAIKSIQQAEDNDVDHYIKGWIFLDDWALRGMSDLPWKPNTLPLVTLQSSATTNLFYDLDYLKAMVLHPYHEWGYEASESLIQKLFKKQNPSSPVYIPKPILVNWENIELYKKYWNQWLR
ncbi:MAG: sugar ABC transporter substrate-binding protein [Opitutales bacterium]